MRRALAEAELLNSIAVAASSEDDLAGILAAALNQLRHVIPFAGGSVAVVEGHDLVISAAVGPSAESALGRRQPRGRGRSWKVIEEGLPFISHDRAVVPLLWRRQTFGLLEVDAVEPNPFGEDDVRLLQRVATAIAGPVQIARRHAAELQALAEAEAAVRARDVFLGIAAHELKTPVTSMRGYAQLMLRRLNRDGGVESHRLRQAMETIDRQAEKLGRLMTQLLDVSRMDAGRFALEIEAANLVELVRDAVDDLRFRAGDRALRVSAPSAPLFASVDRLRIEQALNNLVDNALKFSPPGEPIDLTVERVDGEIRIAIVDRGPGVPEAQRSRLFERFHQAQSDGFQGGMGLGLYLSRQIVERHGGRLEAEFPAAGGSRFVVTLPGA